ncbi:histidine acid phosphatase superfamily protein, partial [Cystoisospora suis]
ATSNPSLVSVGGGSEGNGGGGGVSQQGASLPGGPAGRVTRCVVVAKWGGELTGIGRKQAEDLGKKFRYELYPGDSAGLLRLHSTFRHDFKIYTSDEGRCQVTSAAFTKGFLDLEGELTPILVALVIRNNKAHALLDDTVPVSERKECKKVLDELLNLNISFRDASEEQLNLVDALFRYTLQPVQLACLKEIDNPWAAMHQVYCSIRKFLDALELPAPLLERKAGAIVSCANCNGGTPGRAPSKRDYESAALPASLGDSSLDVPSVFMPPTVCPSFSTTPSAFPLPTSSCHCHSSSSDSSVTVAGSPPFTRSMACCSSSPAAAHAGRDKVAGNFFTQKVANVKQRWNTLLKEWFDAKTNVFDTSKIADVMDMLRYELIHHQYLMSLEAFSLASHAHKILLPVHAFACPSESGITATQKLRIAAQVVGRLVRKIVRDVTFFRSEDHGRPLNESQRTSAFTDWGKSMTAAAAAARLSPPPAASSPPVTLPFSQTGSLVPVEPSASVEFFSSSRPPTGACLPLDVSRYSSSSLSAAAVSHVRRQFSEPVVRIVRPAVQSSECTFPVTLTAPPSPASGGAPETAGAQAERFLPVNGHTSLGTDGPPISQRPGGPDESELVGNGAAFSESSLQDGLDVGKQEHPSGGSGLESRVSESSETAVLADAGTAALSVGLDRHLSIEGQENRRCADDETRTAAALATAAAAAVTAVARAAKAAADAATAAAAEAAADAAPTAAAPLGELVKAMCGVHGTGVSASSIYRPDPAWKGSRDLDRSPPVSELTASTARACLRASLTAPPSASPFPERAMDTLPCTTVDSRVGSPSSEVPSTGPTAGLASSSVPAAAVLGGRMIRSSSSASCCSSGRSAARGISSARGRSTGSNASSSAAKGRAAFGYCGSSSRASSSRISSKSAVAGGGSVCSIAAVSGSTGGSQLEKGGGNLMGSAGSGTVGSSGPVAQSPTAAGLCGVLGSVERIGATGSLGRTPPGDSATAVLKGSKADPAEKVVINSHELWAHQWKGKKREKREEKATSHPQAQQCRAPESTEQCSPTDGMTIAEISPRLLGLRDRNAESCSTPERQSDQDGRQGTSEEVEIKALHEKRRETTGVDGGSKTDLQPGNAGERLEDKGGETKGNEQQGRHAADENERDDEEDHEEHEDDDPHEHEMTAQIRLKEEEARMFGIRSPWRIVRSRYYVTSASHVQALLNILLFSYEVVCGPDQNQSREGSAANRDRTVQKTDSEGSERGGTIGSACSEPLLDSDVDEEALGTCDLHYLSHIVFRVWERKRDRGQPEKSGTADSRYSSPAKHEKTAVGRQPTVAASPPAQQSSRNSDVSSSPYRLEISFSTGAKDGFGRDFFLIERDAQQHQVLSRGAAGPGMAGESGIKTDPRAAGNCRGYEGGSLPGMSQPRAVLGPPRFTPSFLKRGLHDEEDDDFVGLHHEQACRSCACPPATRLSADGVGGDAQRSCRTTKALESETVRPVQTGCRPASSCGWYCPSQASSGAPNSDSDSDVAGARMDGREQRRPAERPGTSPPASCAFGLFSRPTWPAQGSGHSISSSVAPPECVSTSGRTGGGPGSDGVQGDSGYDSKPGHLCWGREEASQLLRGRRGPGATGVAAEDSRGGSYKGAGVLMAPYCELAPLVSLAHSSDLERFEVLMSKVLSLYGSQKCPKTNKDRAP